MQILVSLLAFLRGKFAGKKTYLATAGLLGLAVYQFSQANYEGAVQSLGGACAAAGLRAAIAAPKA